MENSEVLPRGDGGGTVLICAGRFVLENPSADLVLDNHSSIVAEGGDIEIDAQNLTMRNGAELLAYDGGGIRVETAETFAISGEDTQISTSTEGAHPGGDILVSAETIELSDRATLSTASEGAGQAGNIGIVADRSVTLEGGSGIITSKDGGAGTGAGGAVTVKAQDLVIDGSYILTRTSRNSGTGTAGSIYVDVAHLRIDGRESAGPPIVLPVGFLGFFDFVQFDLAGILSLTGVNGDGIVLPGTTASAGNVRVRADAVRIDGKRGSDGTVSVTGIGSLALLSSESAKAGETLVVGRPSENNPTSDRVGSLVLNDGGIIISSTFNADGDAGNVVVQADEFSARGFTKSTFDIFGSPFEFDLPTGVDSSALGLEGLTRSSGNAGDVKVTARNLALVETGAIGASTFTEGNAGTIVVKVDNTLNIDGGESPSNTGITASAEQRSTGAAGIVEVTADVIEIDGGSRSPDRLSELRPPETGIGTLARAFSTRDAGETTVTARVLNLSNGGAISSSTRSEGNAGKVTVRADELSLSGIGFVFPSAIGSTAEEGSSGNAGETVVMGMSDEKVDTITLQGGGLITSRTRAAGNAGDVTVKADRIVASGFGVIDEDVLSSGIGSSAGEGSTGNAGNTDVAADYLELRDGGFIGSRTFGSGNAGGAIVNAREILLTGIGSAGGNSVHSEIGTSAEEGSGGSAGDVVVDVSGTLTIENGGRISSSTQGPGAGGKIRVHADRLVLDGAGSAISADTRRPSIAARPGQVRRVAL